MKNIIAGLIICISLLSFYGYRFTPAEEPTSPYILAQNTSLNIVYRGIPNPISVRAFRTDQKNITLTVNDGEIKSGGNDLDLYIVTPGKNKTLVISGSALSKDSSLVALNSIEFRVKNIPDPIATFGGKDSNESSISKKALAELQGVRSKFLNFEFPVRSDITEYKFSVLNKENEFIDLGKAQGKRFTKEMKAALQKTPQKIFITEIKAQMPDGIIRQLSPIVLDVI